jgi:lysozyme
MAIQQIDSVNERHSFNNIKAMKLDEKGLLQIIAFEGLELKPYLCPAGIPTIAGGCTFYPNGRKVTMKDPSITRAKAIEITRFVANLFSNDVASLVKSKITQNQHNALTSFAYNLGSDIDADDIPEGLGDSTLLKLINANPNNRAIAAEFLKWNKSNGKPLPGLTKRRTKESQIYFTP